MAPVVAGFYPLGAWLTVRAFGKTPKTRDQTMAPLVTAMKGLPLYNEPGSVENDFLGPVI